MIKTFAEKYNVSSFRLGHDRDEPAGPVCRLKRKHLTLDLEAQHAVRARQGIPVCNVECKVVGD